MVFLFSGGGAPRHVSSRKREEEHVEKVGFFDQDAAGGGVAVDEASLGAKLGTLGRRERRVWRA